MKKFQKILMVGFARENLAKKNGDASINSLSTKIVPKDSPELAQELKTSDCLLVKLGATVDKQTINAAPNLKYVGMFGTGFGRIDTKYARQKGITVCNIAGYSREGVAELVFGMILEHIREIERAKSQARASDYSEATFAGTEIMGKNFGIIGLGRNGQRVAQLAQCFGANVTYWSRHKKGVILP